MSHPYFPTPGARTICLLSVLNLGFQRTAPSKGSELGNENGDIISQKKKELAINEPQKTLSDHLASGFIPKQIKFALTILPRTCAQVVLGIRAESGHIRGKTLKPSS